ncbi:hypothetical protein [Pseudosulfitobacter sp. SM2401]|uniref:hypothetical protein n=1 Tax=Pseudosulfitobacter sp. SM2401 TaxID=3350098 RepID=UPI0036F2FF41
MKALIAMLCLMTSGTLAVAQDQIPPDAFLDIAEGRTLTFSGYISGRVIGEEHFLRRDRSVWADKTGRCTYGRIEVRGPYLCFIYEDEFDPENCWTTYNENGTLLVMSHPGLEIQRISDINDTPLSCQDVPLS